MKIQYFQKMEQALYLVKKGCLAQATIPSVEPCLNAVHAWDLARAYFTGSRDKNDEYMNFERDTGKFPHALGDKRCANFKTCGITQTIDNTYSAVANIKMMNLFRVGGDYVYSGDAEGVEYIITQIESASLVPLIQGTLRFSYRRCFQKKREDKYMAEAAVFAHAILPHIHSCSPKDAATIYKNTKIIENKEKPASECNYAAVQKALRNNYDCLGITCEDVGGYWDSRGYYEDAEPCQRDGNTEVVLNQDLSLDTRREEIGGYLPFTDVTIEVSH